MEIAYFVVYKKSYILLFVNCGGYLANTKTVWKENRVLKNWRTVMSPPRIFCPKPTEA